MPRTPINRPPRPASGPPGGPGRAKTLLIWTLAALLVAAAVWVFIEARPRGRSHTRPFDRAPTPVPGEQPDPFSRLLSGGATGDLLMNAGAQPLESNPADLPTPANTERLIGYRVSTGGLIEDVAVWSTTKLGPEAMGRLIDRAAADRGFAAHGDPPTYGDPPASRIHHRHGQTLTVRIVRRGSAVRVVLHLRYTMNTPPPGD